MRLNLFLNTKNTHSFIQSASIPLQIIPFEFEGAVNFFNKKSHLMHSLEFFTYGKVRFKTIHLDSLYYASKEFENIKINALLDGIWHDNPIINAELHLMCDQFRKQNKKLLKA